MNRTRAEHHQAGDGTEHEQQFAVHTPFILPLHQRLPAGLAAGLSAEAWRRREL